MTKSVLVLSGKGGVGKSLVAANTALKLREFGYKVGILDCDVSNPNIPQLLGISEGYVDIEMTKEGMRRLVPYRYDGIQVFSSALLSKDKPISFSGQQTSELLRDIVQYGNWEADVFVVDLPAGLGDELKASVKVMADILVGSIIVAQPAHIDEAERVIKLHLINEIPVVGLIENMAVLRCPHQGCEEKWHIFGEPRGKALAETYGIEFLGEIPLIPNLRQNPILKGEYAKPIQRAAEKILDMKPTRPGFLTRVKEKAKEITREMALDVIATMYKVIIKEVDIRELQETFGYPGGKIIRLNLWDDNFENIIAQADFIVEEGRLKYLREEEVARRGGPHTRIDAKARALAWAFNGKKRVGDREIPYELVDAWFNGDINIYGSGETIRAIDFMLATWDQMRKVAPEKIMSLVKYLA
jgi:ATP-binding protein involved in chromosome partitioning